MVFPAVNSQILTIGVFIGIVVSMIFYERELLSPGGVVVPGYTALFLITNPIIVVYTLLIALLTGLIIKKASRISILFGRSGCLDNMGLSQTRMPNLIYVFATSNVQLEGCGEHRLHPYVR